jgi:hypothetical protein
MSRQECTMHKGTGHQSALKPSACMPAAEHLHNCCICCSALCGTQCITVTARASIRWQPDGSQACSSIPVRKCCAEPSIVPDTNVLQTESMTEDGTVC